MMEGGGQGVDSTASSQVGPPHPSIPGQFAPASAMQQSEKCMALQRKTINTHPVAVDKERRTLMPTLRSCWRICCRRSGCLPQAGCHLLLRHAQPHQGLIDLALDGIKVQLLAGIRSAGRVGSAALSCSWCSLRSSGSRPRAGILTGCRGWPGCLLATGPGAAPGGAGPRISAARAPGLQAGKSWGETLGQ